MLHNGADHTTIAMHDQPTRKPLSRSVNRVTRVTEAMNHPMLQNLVAIPVGVHGAAVASASRRLSLADRNLKIRHRLRLCDDLIAIDGVDG
jgi:hypothetical protein